MRVAVTADHNGVAVKDRLVAYLEAHGHEVDDRAAHVGAEIVDYPPLCEDVLVNGNFGVLESLTEICRGSSSMPASTSSPSHCTTYNRRNRQQLSSASSASSARCGGGDSTRSGSSSGSSTRD
jgi:hypothetical protein